MQACQKTLKTRKYEALELANLLEHEGVRCVILANSTYKDSEYIRLNAHADYCFAQVALKREFALTGL